MKKIIILILTGILSVQAVYSQLQSKSDERFELTSIVFRIAGIPEYNQCGITSYAKDIDTYFAPFANDPLFEFVRTLRKESAIAYDAVPVIASMLEIKNGIISLQSQYNLNDVVEADSRWSEEQFIRYLKLLNKFYKKSNFRKFYKAHEALYTLAQERLNDLLADIDTSWFLSFFGKPLDPNIKIYVSLTNGPHNYSFNDGILIGIFGTHNGEPVFSIYQQITILHELCHHYSNPVFNTHWAEMKEAANKIYPIVQMQMNKIAYGTAKSSFMEWFNNLCVLMYYKELPEDYGLEALATSINTNDGFIWMHRSVEFMENFYADRVTYPNIEYFMPQLSLFLNFTATNMDFVQREFNQRRPYIKSVYPAVGSDITNVKEIRIEFSEPMRTDCQGVWLIDDPNIKYIPNDSDGCRWIDVKTFLIPISTERLEPNQVYGVKIFSRFFYSDKNYPLEDKYTDLIFKTK